MQQEMWQKTAIKLQPVKNKTMRCKKTVELIIIINFIYIALITKGFKQDNNLANESNKTSKRTVHKNQVRSRNNGLVQPVPSHRGSY